MTQKVGLRHQQKSNAHSHGESLLVTETTVAARRHPDRALVTLRVDATFQMRYRSRVASTLAFSGATTTRAIGDSRMFLTRLRFSVQLIILTVGTALVVTILLVALAFSLAGAAVRQEADQRVTALTHATAELLTAPLSRHDITSIQQILA